MSNRTEIQETNFSEAFRIDEDSPVPIWIQIKNRMIRLIMSDAFREGDRLPSMRQLAVEFEVNLNTISKVFQDLQRDGFIESRRGKGLFVAKDGKADKSVSDDAFKLLANEFIDKCLASGLTPADVKQLVEESLDDKRS